MLTEHEGRLLARIVARNLSDYLDANRHTMSDAEFEQGVICLGELIDYGGNPA